MNSKEKMIALLGGAAAVDLNATGFTELYVVPAKKLMIVDHVLPRDLSADAANAVATFGQSTDKDDFVGAQKLSNLSAAGKATKIAPQFGRLTGSDTWDPGSIADGDEEAKEVTVTGAALGDFVRASFSLDVADLVLDAKVTAAGIVTCVLANNTGGAVDLNSGTISVEVFNMDRPAALVEYAAGASFGVDVTVVAGSACTADFDVLGRLVDA